MSPVVDVVGELDERGCVGAKIFECLLGLLNSLLSEFSGLFDTKEGGIGRFSTRFVSTGRFTQNCGSRGLIKQVVNDLKSQSDCLPIAGQLINPMVFTTARQSPGLDRTTDKCAGLGAMDGPQVFKWIAGIFSGNI